MPGNPCSKLCEMEIEPHFAARTAARNRRVIQRVVRVHAGGRARSMMQVDRERGEPQLTTAHAGSARAALDRLELLLQRAGDATPSSIRRHVESAFDVIVHELCIERNAYPSPLNYNR